MDPTSPSPGHFKDVSLHPASGVTIVGLTLARRSNLVIAERADVLAAYPVADAPMERVPAVLSTIRRDAMSIVISMHCAWKRWRHARVRTSAETSAAPAAASSRASRQMAHSSRDHTRRADRSSSGRRRPPRARSRVRARVGARARLPCRPAGRAWVARPVGAPARGGVHLRFMFECHAYQHRTSQISKRSTRAERHANTARCRKSFACRFCWLRPPRIRSMRQCRLGRLPQLARLSVLPPTQLAVG